MGMYENGREYAEKQLGIDIRTGEPPADAAQAIIAKFREELTLAERRLAGAEKDGERQRWQDQIDWLRGGLARLADLAERRP